MTKVFLDVPDCRVGKVVSRLSREDMTLFIYTITEHNNMNSIIIPDYTPLCRKRMTHSNIYTRNAPSSENKGWKYKEIGWVQIREKDERRKGPCFLVTLQYCSAGENKQKLYNGYK